MNNQATYPGAADDQLAELRKAEILAHTRYPKLGPWYPPTAGAIAGLWVASYALPSWANVVATISFVVIASAATAAYNKRRGTLPNFRRTPGPIRNEILLFVVTTLVIVGLLGLVWNTTTWWITSLVAAVVTTIGIALYERRYANAARRVEAEAGITRRAS